ncbi:ATP-binding protein [Thermobifida halotolerans]|uniref:ATP-binding protein n=2 Tax=Thermobifida halotolerans TaxID=483545 RepID=A0A399FYJ6_9ACTN|nr:ATP-binding protein [Thermobifida halotolerans]UOE22180.1 ATP-binding protein [Thermobifida halotolerans]
MADPFGVTELRRRVLDGWADSPARFREDANAEEDYALGGYRDRVVVELAQNAADAAQRAGVRGRLRLVLRGREFTAANTGAPLTPEGVESLSTLRASAKRDAAAVGRFGVGFTSVASISDDVVIASRGGAVRWSRELAAAAVRGELVDAGRARPELAEELVRRGGRVPLLRLPFADDARPPEGYDSAVTLLLRDADAGARLALQLAEAGQALLLALPWLAEVEIDADGQVRSLHSSPGADGRVAVRSVDAGGEHVTHWHTLTRSGRFTPEELADRPTEERDRRDWSLTWAVALDSAGGAAELPADVPHVVHAPTPSDEELHVPALLIGTFPMTPDRRRIAPGTAADTLTDAAAAAYTELLCHLDAPATWDLIPLERLGGGEFDARFRARVTRLLPDTPFLRTVADAPIRPRDAVVVEGGGDLLDVLGDLVPNALPGDWNLRHPGLRALRLRRIGLADLADLLGDLDREPAWWARLYAALREAGRHGADLGELGALPVPLWDGRLVRGPRGLLLPTGPSFTAGTLDAEALVPLGLRIAHPEAVDPLLVRLGAIEANERAVLTDPMTRAAVQHSLDSDDPDAIAQAVLELVAASATTIEDEPWLAELALRDADGDYSPAAELLHPDSPLLDILTDDAPFGVLADDLAESYDAEVLESVGVVRLFIVHRAHDVTLGAALEESLDEVPLDGVAEWAAEISALLGRPELPPVVPELVGVRDLEFVREDRWPQALELLAAPGPRAAVIEPTRVLTGDGRAVDVPSYTAWWLRTGALLGDHVPVELRAADADPALTGLYDEIPTELDREFARALGVRTDLTELLAAPDGPDDLLDRLGDSGRSVSRASLRRLWAALAEVPADGVSPPERVRAVQDGSVVVADAEDTVVMDAPDLLPLFTGQPVVLGPVDRAADLADVLDLDLASETVEGRITSSGEVRPVPDEVRVFLGGAPLTYLHHAELRVDGVEVEWRSVGGHLHASTTDGLARALCWATGQWSRRHLIAALLRDPQTLPVLRAEVDLE